MSGALRLVCIEWVDSVCADQVGWCRREGVAGLTPDIITSVGWVLRDDDDSITIVAHNGEDMVGGDMCIPKVAVRKVVDLRPAQSPQVVGCT